MLLFANDYFLIIEKPHSQTYQSHIPLGEFSIQVNRIGIIVAKDFCYTSMFLGIWEDALKYYEIYNESSISVLLLYDFCLTGLELGKYLFFYNAIKKAKDKFLAFGYAKWSISAPSRTVCVTYKY